MKQDYQFDPIRGFHLKKLHSPSNEDRLHFEKISPLLRALLVTDGTVTKFLEAYLWEPIEVKPIFQENSIANNDVPWLEIKQGMSVFKRQVLLRGLSNGKIYAFAESLVRTDRLSNGLYHDLLEGRLGMGELLRDRRMETYRELLNYGREKAGTLSSVLNMDMNESVLYRSYRIFNNQLPVILITEKFPEYQFI